MKDYYGDELKTYVIEIAINNCKKYMRTKNVALYFIDSARKFSHIKSAKRYYKDSVFDQLQCEWRVIEYMPKDADKKESNMKDAD